MITPYALFPELVAPLAVPLLSRPYLLIKPLPLTYQGFLQVLSRVDSNPSRWQTKVPEGSPFSGRRTALANWLNDTQSGAGALAADLPGAARRVPAVLRAVAGDREAGGAGRGGGHHRGAVHRR